MIKNLSSTFRAKLRQFGLVSTIAMLAAFCIPMTSYAATAQQLYLSPNTYTPALKSEFVVPIRINTTTPVDAVTATLAYNPKLIQYVSVDATGSAFPISIYTQTSSVSVTIDRGIFSGTVNTDSLVASIKFKALAPTDYTKITLTGNATYAGEYTNPALLSAKVVIKDLEAPTVYALKPAEGTRSTTSFSIGAASRDNVRIVKKEIYIDGALVHTGTAWNIYYTWDVRSDSVAKGAHTVTAKAYDPSGNVGTSSVTLYKD